MSDTRIWRHEKCVGQRKNAVNKLKTRKKHESRAKSIEKCLLQEFSVPKKPYATSVSGILEGY